MDDNQNGNQGGTPPVTEPASTEPTQQEQKCVTCGNAASAGNCVACGQGEVSCTCTPAQGGQGPTTPPEGGEMGGGTPPTV